MNSIVPPTELKLQLHSKPENINLLEPFIKKVCEHYTLTDEQIGDITLVLTEAVNNSIHHGNECCPEKQVIVLSDLKQDIITFTIQDEGKGFDPSLLPDPTAPENIAKPNGRGVYLMREFANDVVVRQTDAGYGCQVVVQFKIS